jgi:hypothetical protein
MTWRAEVERSARRAIQVVLPVALPVFAVGLVPTAIGLGAGYGFGISPLAVTAIVDGVGVVLMLVVLAVVGTGIAGLIQKGRGQAGTDGWWGRLNRPIGEREEVSPPVVRDVQKAPRKLAVERLGRILSRVWVVVVVVEIGLVAAVFIGATVAGLNLGQVVKRRLDAAIKAAEHEEPHWRINDLVRSRKPVPEPLNSAVVANRVASLLAQDVWPRGSGSMLAALSSEESRRIEQDLDVLEQTAPNRQLDSRTAAHLGARLETDQEAVKLARSLATMGDGRHELRLTPSLVDIPLKETYESRAVARLLLADAAVRSQDRDIDGALESARAILGVSRSIGDEPLAVSLLSRASIGSEAIQAVERALGQGEAGSDDVLAQVQASLMDELAEPMLVRALRGERAIADEEIRRIRDAEIPIEWLSGTPSPVEELITVRRVSPWGRLAFDYQRALALEWSNELIAIAKRPAAERGPLREAFLERTQAVERSWWNRPIATLATLFVPTTAKIDLAHARYQAKLGASVLLVAAERQRRRTGAWPDSIAAIDPSILPQAPLDPFAGGAYRYAVEADGLVVWSIGPNGRDDGGEDDKKTWRRGGPDDSSARAWEPKLRRLAPEELELELEPSGSEDGGEA